MTQRSNLKVDDRLPDIPADILMAQRLEAKTLSRSVPGLLKRRIRLFTSGQFGHISHGGIFNPGAILRANGYLLLCRSEADGRTWTGDWFASMASPILCWLGADYRLESFTQLEYKHHPNTRPEDWRLFEYQGNLYSNYSTYFMTDDGLKCLPGIAEVDEANGCLVNHSLLTPPFSAMKEEKNWSFFPHEGDLLCIYSINPYIVLRLDMVRSNALTVHIAHDSLTYEWIQKSRQFISCSTNPIEWDDNNLVLFIHDFLEHFNSGGRNRTYLQYGMLIDKKTLLPTSIIPTPLLMGGREEGRHSGVHYTMSLVNRPQSLLAFFGEGDMHTGVIEFDKEILNRLFASHPVKTK